LPEQIHSDKGRLYRYVLFSTILIVVIIIILIFLTDETSLSMKLSSIAAGLSSSLLYTLILNWRERKVYEEFMGEKIRDNFATHSAELMRKITEISKKHIPSEQYPGTPGFDSRFNSDIQSDIHQTRNYLFRGTSAKYVPARLQASRNSIETVRIIISHPGFSSALKHRSADRTVNNKYQGRTMDEIEQELQYEILESLVNLFDLRKQYNIEIALLQNDPSVTRVEVFDSCCYVALYRSAQAQEFPETIRYEANTTLNDMFRLECVRQFEDSEKINLSTINDDEALLDTFRNKLNIQNLGVSDIHKLREKGRQFTEKFIEKLSKI